MCVSCPEIEAYLDARRTVPLDALRTVGTEKPLYEYYLLNDETFSGCLGSDDARLVSSARADELRSALERKAEADRYAGLIERVADCLAERNPKYMDGLAEEYQAYFDSSDARKGYLQLQEELCDLRLAGRAMPGRHFAGLIEKAERAQKPAMTYSSVRYDGKPNFVYVLTSGRGESRAEPIERARTLLLGAMAFYDKRRGMAIVDRDSVSFEVLMLEVPQHSIAAFHVGRRGRAIVWKAPNRTHPRYPGSPVAREWNRSALESLGRALLHLGFPHRPQEVLQVRSIRCDV